MRRYVAAALVIAGVALCLGVSLSRTTRADDRSRQAAFLDHPDERWRFGVCVSRKRGLISDYDISELQIGWYCDYVFREEISHPQGLEYMQMISTKDELFPLSGDLVDRIEAAAAANPGCLWQIGNEPDCIDQDNNVPGVYAERFHELRGIIKGADPTAQIANGAVVQPTPLRLEWLDRVIEEYYDSYTITFTEQVDVWSIHNQILAENRYETGCRIPPGLPYDEGRPYTREDSDNLDIFISHIQDFRQWMKKYGLEDKSLIVSEYGVLMPEWAGFTADRVNDFMSNSFTYLLNASDPETGCPWDGNRLVQRWAWFSLNENPWDGDPLHPGGFNGALFEWDSSYPGVLTSHGEHWIEFMDDQPFPTPTPSTTPPPPVFDREAEAGSLDGSATVRYDASASECSYVTIPVENGSVSLSHYVTEPGDYLIWARVLSSHDEDTSLRVAVDGGPEFDWDFPGGQAGWVWDRVSERDGADPKTFWLSEGWHDVEFSCGANSARIDTLEFMRWDTEPARDVEPCGEPIPSAVELDLLQGYNLVSLPVIAPGTGIDEALSVAWESISRAYAYDASNPEEPWLVYDKALPPWADTLVDLHSAEGFWVFVDAAGTYTVDGQYPGTTDIQLYQGANLIGYPCTEVRPVANVLAPIEGKWSRIYAYDGTDPSRPWRVNDAGWEDWRNEFTEFEPGKAYWVYVTEDCILSIVN